MENAYVNFLEDNESPNDKENNVEKHRTNENRILLKDDKNLKIIRSKKKEKKEDDEKGKENEKVVLFENNEIVEYDASYFKNTNNNIVLMEEDYLEVLEYLIEKTFFPDLHKLKNEKGMLSNYEFNNKEYSNMNYKSNSLCPPSPNTFIDEDNNSVYGLMDRYQTDLSSDLQRCSSKNNILSCVEEKRKKKTDKNSKYKLVVLPSGKKHKINLNIKLSDFQKLYTSEDNKSFEYLLRNMKNKNIEKNMYSIIKKNEYNMKMDYIEKCTKNGIKCDMLHLNKSENELCLMNISSSYKSSENILNRQGKNIIAYKNTRFSDEYNEDIKNQINQCEENKQMKLLARDRENKEEEMVNKGVFNLLQEKNGYKYVKTPMIEAGKGVDKSPIITWGKIMNTPMLLRDNEEENDEKEESNREKNKYDYLNLNKESSNCDIDNYLKNEFTLQKLNNREIVAEKLQNSLRDVKYNNKEILKKKRFNMLVKKACSTSSRMSTTSFRSYVLSRKSQKRLNELSQKSSLASQILRKK